jgi:SAM-dependent methyltransferase
MKFERSSREFIRHLIIRSGLNDAYLAFREARGADVGHLRSQTLGERFSAIYSKGVWLNDRQFGSRSGLGSELENTEAIRGNLPGLLSRIGTKTLLDVGCGDFNWMRTLALDCHYVGVDVAEDVIASNNRQYSSADRTFTVLDATRNPMPVADTVLCREVLFHLSFSDIRSFVRNLRASGAVNLIATTDVATDFNADIISGDFRLLNLTKSPFRFRPPALSIPDDALSPGRVLGVWRVRELPEL